MNNPIQPNKSYDEAMSELEEIVQAMEDETLGIDDLAEKIKAASELINFCRQKLRSTEEEISTLLENMNPK